MLSSTCITLIELIFCCRARFQSLRSKFGVTEAETRSHNGSSDRPVSSLIILVILYHRTHPYLYRGVLDFVCCSSGSLTSEWQCIIEARKEWQGTYTSFVFSPFIVLILRCGLRRPIGRSFSLSRFISV